MNKNRRKQIEEIASKLEDIKDAIDNVYQEEYEAFCSLPDNLQESERGETMSENSDDLEQAVQDVDDLITTLLNIVDR